MHTGSNEVHVANADKQSPKAYLKGLVMTSIEIGPNVKSPSSRITQIYIYPPMGTLEAK